MSSTIQVYASRVEVEDDINGFKHVTLENVDANDFVHEFTADEVLDAMDFDVIADYVTKRLEEDYTDFSGAE